MSDTQAPPHRTHALTKETAAYWLQRWDRQQEHYLPLRTERFEVIADVVQASARTENPLIVDLGVGPGSLARHLLERIPGARVVGIDADPLLLALAETGVGPHHRTDDGGSRLRLVDADLRKPGWLELAGLEREPDAYVSTTALHWMRAAELRTLIAACGSFIAPGGSFVDGDHIYLMDQESPFDALSIELGAAESLRRGVADHEDWQAWWDGVHAEPEFASLVRAREGRLADRGGDPGRLHDYLDGLAEAGFAHVGVVWQYGDDRVVAGVGHLGSA